jgi:hypothetical protein
MKQETLEEALPKNRWKYVGKQETLEEVAVIYAHNSFIWPLNKQGEKQSIPPGQIVPPGYTKHQKIATKHFIAGYKLAQERSYSEEDVLNFAKYILSKEVTIARSPSDVSSYLPKEFKLLLGELEHNGKELLKKWFEKFKNK